MKSLKSYQLKNNNGITIEFTNYGARLTSIKVPDNDSFVDILLGYDDPLEYVNGDPYMNAICGRFANRINKGEFQLEGRTIKLDKNDGQNHLHGGNSGFNAKIWNVKPVEKKGCTSAYELSLTSEDGDENYPGNLDVKVIFALNNNNELLIDILATTDKTTIVNLTSHPYFNLNGVGNGDILNHKLQVNAKVFTPLAKEGLPMGEIRSVNGTAMDLNHPKLLNEVVTDNYEQIEKVAGLDHNWVINKKDNELGFAAKIIEPKSNRFVEVFTTQPGLQVYTAMHFNGTETGKKSIPFTKYYGIAIEAQNFPNSPNIKNFPSPILKPDLAYEQTIIYKFGF